MSKPLHLGSEIARERVLANWRRPEDRYPSKSQKDAKKALRAGNSNQHLTLLRMMECTTCHRRTGIQAHHLTGGEAAKTRGVGRKAPDKFALPLCAFCHLGPDGVHSVGSRREAAWFTERGIDAHAFVAALWGNSGDIGRLNRVQLAHKLAASKLLLERKKP